MRPNTRLKSPSATSCMKRHSIDTGASDNRGGATRSDDVSASLASLGSSTPLGKSIEVILICCARENDTRLTTNCSLARILARVSFGSPGARLPMPTPTVAGLEPNTLENENGAAFTDPFLSLVVIHAMGRGMTVARSSLYRSAGFKTSKSNNIPIFQIEDWASRASGGFAHLDFISSRYRSAKIPRSRATKMPARPAAFPKLSCHGPADRGCRMLYRRGGTALESLADIARRAASNR